jgi:hypothetical protein
MLTSKSTLPRLLLVTMALAVATPAAAIPAFARKYSTSCLTCHTVYPKLTPFGEAFRRNGYLFPGIDSDLVKAQQIPMGQEANKKTFPNSVWPSSIPVAVPLSFGVNGTIQVTPSKTSSAGLAANGAQVTMQDLAGEAHIWAGTALDDDITVWAEATFASDGTVDVEHAQLLFNNLIGPRHAVNLIVGHGFPNVTQYGPHSSYLGDQLQTTVPVTGIYQGNPDAWTLVDNYTGMEVNGVVAGLFDYAAGLNSGKSNRISATDNFYGRIGFKVGGMRLDGEGSTGAADALRPWAEDALGVYAFGYQSNSRLDTTTAPTANDVANVLGLGGRGQYGSAELNVGWYNEAHNHGMDDGSKVTAQVAFAELSYVVYPWLVPALRIERVSLKPAGGTSARDIHIEPGVAFLIRPNIKLVAVFNYEAASGFPTTAGNPGALPPLAPGPVGWQGGGGGAGPLQIAPPPSGKSSLSEFETIGIYLAWAI